MHNFKKGDKVVCFDAGSNIYIKNGTTYEVSDHNNSEICVYFIREDGTKERIGWYTSYRFKHFTGIERLFEELV